MKQHQRTKNKQKTQPNSVQWKFEVYTYILFFGRGNKSDVFSLSIILTPTNLFFCTELHKTRQI